jgi:hypothetical protein
MTTRSPRRFPHADGTRASVNIIVDDLLNDLLETVLANLREGLFAGSGQATALSKRETSGTPRQRAEQVASGRVIWFRGRATFRVLVPGVSQWSATFVYRVRRDRGNAVKPITFWAWPEVDPQPHRTPGIEFCIFPGAWLDLAKLRDRSFEGPNKLGLRVLFEPHSDDAPSRSGRPHSCMSWRHCGCSLPIARGNPS